MLRSAFIVASVVACAAPALADSGTIGAIPQVAGNLRVEADTVRTYAGLRVGDSLGPTQLDRAKKALYATGFFSDVSIAPQNNSVLIRVTENPLVQDVTFEGNDRYDSKDLDKEISLKAGSLYTAAKVQNDVKRLQDLYRRGGRYSAVITPQLVNSDDHRVRLIYKVTEGEVSYVEKIAFVGNKAFSSATLRDALETREDRWWRVLSSTTTYDSDRAALDEERLRQFYFSHGYADFKVLSSSAELSPDRTGFAISYVISEGLRYKISSLTVNSNIAGLSTDGLLDFVSLSQGDAFNAEKLRKGSEDISRELGKRGYPFVNVGFDIKRDTPNQQAQIIYSIARGAPQYVERIDIEGNVRTYDKVIRRELALSEGDALNRALLERSKRNVRGLNFFETVDITDVAGSTPDKRIIKVKVKEASTGDVSVGVGYSTTDSVLGQASIAERNLMGTGRAVKLSTSVSGRRKEFDFSYTEPWVMNRPMSAGFDLYHSVTDYQSEASYDQSSTGGVLRTSFKQNDNLTVRPRYTVSSDTVSNIKTTASSVIKSAEGTAISSGPGIDLVYDRRDDIINPTSGYVVRYGIDGFGLGGDVRMAKSTFTASWYKPLWDQYIFNIIGETGAILPYGGYKPRVIDRFMVGSDNLRGFRVAGVGPRDTATDDALGGNYYGIMRNELTFPINGLDELGINGVLFGDVGTLWGLNNARTAGASTDDSAKPRASVGLGVKWASPLGPLRLDFAQAVLKEKYDKTEIFRFSIGSQF